MICFKTEMIHNLPFQRIPRGIQFGVFLLSFCIVHCYHMPFPLRMQIIVCHKCQPVKKQMNFEESKDLCGSIVLYHLRSWEVKSVRLHPGHSKGSMLSTLAHQLSCTPMMLWNVDGTFWIKKEFFKIVFSWTVESRRRRRGRCFQNARV